MKTLLSVGFLVVAAIAASFLFLFVLNLAGLPGALVARGPQRGFSWRWFFGFLLATLGQSFVALGYVAFIVNWTRLAILHQALSGLLFWPVAFLAVAIPICKTYYAAMREAKHDGYFELQHAQFDALGWTTFITVAGFFVFAFFPGLMRVSYPWVPYVMQ